MSISIKLLPPLFAVDVFPCLCVEYVDHERLIYLRYLESNSIYVVKIAFLFPCANTIVE